MHSLCFFCCPYFRHVWHSTCMQTVQFKLNPCNYFGCLWLYALYKSLEYFAMDGSVYRCSFWMVWELETTLVCIFFLWFLKLFQKMAWGVEGKKLDLTSGSPLATNGYTFCLNIHIACNRGTSRHLCIHTHMYECAHTCTYILCQCAIFVSKTCQFHTKKFLALLWWKHLLVLRCSIQNLLCLVGCWNGVMAITTEI